MKRKLKGRRIKKKIGGAADNIIEGSLTKLKTEANSEITKAKDALKGNKLFSSAKKIYNTIPFIGNYKSDSTEEFQGSGKDEYLNENYKKELPYITEYLPELDKEEIEKKITKDKIKVKKAEADYKTSKIIFKDEKDKKFVEQENDKKVDLKKYTANLASQDASDLRNFKAFGAIMTFIATSSKETISKFIDVLGEIIPLLLKIINSDIIIKHLIPLAVIIGTVIFIMYIMGFKVNTGNAPTAPNKPEIKVAESKPEYSKSDSIYDKMMKIIMSIPGLKNVFSNYKEINTSLTKILGGVDTLEQYSINRDTIKEGRNDNIYNIKLGNYFGKKDNDAYSIIIPADLEIKYEENKELLTDLNTLPKGIQEEILKDKKNIKLKWDLENNKFIMRCNNSIDEKGNIVKLYGDCSKKNKLPNINYNRPRERLEYNTLNALVPLDI